MHLHDIQRLLQDAGMSDYVIGTFYVRDATQAAGVLAAAKELHQPVGLRLASIDDVEMVAGMAAEAAIPAMLQVVVTDIHQARRAFEAGVLAFYLPIGVNEMVDELQMRGAYVEISSSHNRFKTVAVSVHPTAGHGAFTGRQYVSLDRIRQSLHGRQGLVTVEIPPVVSHNHLRELIQLPVSQLLFDVREMDVAETAILVSEYLPVLGNKNTATIYS